VNNLLKVITRRKVSPRDLNLQPTDPEADTLATQPPRLNVSVCDLQTRVFRTSRLNLAAITPSSTKLLNSQMYTLYIASGRMKTMLHEIDRKQLQRRPIYTWT